MIIVKKRPMSDANRKRLQHILGIKPVLRFLSVRETIQWGEQLLAGLVDGIQLTDPAFAIRIRTLVEEKTNERQG
jgi:hypothetical protein